ncbi:MAG TPA: NUDIX hydrolase [Sphingomicrobium sp.]|nr:NUDIX hydrolase [Sphingomicrobium sp.]
MTETPAIPATTLIVIHDRPEGPPELLMVERAKEMAFAGGALVFPGGRIDDGDRALAADFSLEDGAARIAAIRETLEETAIAVGILPVPASELCRELQHALLAGEHLSDLLIEHGLQFDLQALTAFARWVPKFHAVRRFETLFFVARAPQRATEPRVAGGECASAFWITANEALELERSGGTRLIFPTRRNLERLALHGSFDAIRSDALAHSLEPITPWAETIDGDEYITIPADRGYPVTREKLDGLWRG